MATGAAAPNPPEDGNGGSDDGQPKPDPTPDPTPPITPTTPTDIPKNTTPPIVASDQTPDIPASGIAGEPADTTLPSAKQDKPDKMTPTPDQPTPSAKPTEPPIQLESEETLAVPKPEPKGSGVLPVAVGCAAVAGTIGAAGLYLHPQALKRLLELLRKLLSKA